MTNVTAANYSPLLSSKWSGKRIVFLNKKPKGEYLK